MKSNKRDSLIAIYNRFFGVAFMQRIIRNSGYLLTATVISAGLGMTQKGFQLRVLDASGLGLLAAISAFTNVVNRFTSFRIDEVVVRYVSEYMESNQNEKAAAAFKFACILEVAGSAIAFLLIILLAPLGEILFSDQKGVENIFILYGTLSLGNLVFDSSDGLLRVFNRFDTKAKIEISQSVIRVLLTVVVWRFGLGLTGIIIAELMGRFIRSLAIVLSATKIAGHMWGKRWIMTPLGVLGNDRNTLLKFALNTNLSSSISLVAKDSESLWINGFLGNIIGGYYDLALSLVGFMQIPIGSLPSTTYPELVRAAVKKEWESFRIILRRGTEISIIYTVVISIALIVFGKQIILVLSGNEIFLASYPILKVLLIGYGIANIFYWNRAALLSLSEPGFSTLINLVGAVLKIVGIIIFVPIYGFMAFAVLISSYYIFTVGSSAWRVNNILNRHVYRS